MEQHKLLISTTLPAELPTEVSLVRQAEDRAHRRGQRHAVNVYFLCAKVCLGIDRLEDACDCLLHPPNPI